VLVPNELDIGMKRSGHAHVTERLAEKLDLNHGGHRLGGVSTYGRFELDWMFVRGYARAPRDTRASHRMAPHCAHTLEDIRDATAPRLRDHAPPAVAMPLGDPCPVESCQTDPDGALEHGAASWTDTHEE
jgi:hypothetical protein